MAEHAQVPHPSGEARIPHISEGVPYPDDYVAATIDRPQDAERAVQALRDVGFDPADIVLLHGDEVIENIEAREQHHNFLRRMLAEIAGTTDDAQDEKRYEQDAERGRSIINIYAPDRRLVERAHDILQAHRAHHIKYFGRWAVEDFSPQVGE